MTPTYENMNEIYENYHAPSRFIEFEGHVYKIMNTESKGEINIHHYRCMTERHNLRIHLQGGVPFYVDAFYSVDEVSA